MALALWISKIREMLKMLLGPWMVGRSTGKESLLSAPGASEIEIVERGDLLVKGNDAFSAERTDTGLVIALTRMEEIDASIATSLDTWLANAGKAKGRIETSPTVDVLEVTDARVPDLLHAAVAAEALVTDEAGLVLLKKTENRRPHETNPHQPRREADLHLQPSVRHLLREGLHPPRMRMGLTKTQSLLRAAALLINNISLHYDVFHQEDDVRL